MRNEISPELRDSIKAAVISAIIDNGDLDRLIRVELIRTSADTGSLGRLQSKGQAVRIRQELGRIASESINLYLQDLTRFFNA